LKNGWATAQLSELEAGGLLRRPLITSSMPGPEVRINGRDVVCLCSNNYLGLAAEARVRQAAANASMKWGAGAGASRLVSGSTTIHRDLESRLATLKACEDAMLFSSGYLANTGAIAALVGAGDAVFSDELNHASIVDGCRLSRAQVLVYRHNNLGDLKGLLDSSQAARRLIVTDSIFSMDGDVARLPELAEIARQHDAMLMVDEAHATGVVGPSGGGALEAAGLAGSAYLVMGTLSKAIGGSGGFVAGTGEVIELLRNRARTYIFDTAPSASSAGAAIEALEIMKAEPQRRLTTLRHAATLADGLAALGCKIDTPAAAIIPVLIGESRSAVARADQLLELGVWAPAIRPPSVPGGTARLRLTVMATHTEEHIERALTAFETVLGQKASSSPARTIARSSYRYRAESPAVGGLVSSQRPRGRLIMAAIDPAVVAAGGVFVTGTDTGVGKTYVSALLAKLWGALGVRVAAMKPVQTGTDAGDDDLQQIAQEGGIPPELLSRPYSFPDALAPKVAAERMGREICLEPIIQSCADLRSKADLVIVEGAGGLLAPVAESLTMAELAGRLGMPLIVVARPGLGTLNHTALTLEAARRRGLMVLGVVLNKFPDRPDLAERTNPGAIEQSGDEVILGIVPDNQMNQDPAGCFSSRLGGRFAHEGFLESLAL